MRKISLALLIVFIIAGCLATTVIDLPKWPVLNSDNASSTIFSTPTEIEVQDTTVPPTATVVVSPTPEASPTIEFPPAATATQADTAGFTVRVHPENGLYVGDQVSFEVISPPNGPKNGDSVQLEVTGASPQDLGEQKFDPYGIGGRTQATFLWTWNTAGLAPADYDLRFTVQPEGPVFTETLTLLPASELPADEIGAHWEETKSQCCVVQYITGTAAERDLQALLLEMDNQANDAANRMGIGLSETITVTLIPRVLGHGGFTSNEIGISYLDRNYADGSLGMILHHELIHVLDSRLGGDLRPNLFVEGLAVYESGGHYKPEPLMPRAATLLDEYGNPAIKGLNWYIPLKTLADQFYTSQHELGYLEAASLIEFMVQRWGWQSFSDFYRDIHPDDSGSQAEAIDNALQSHFGLSFDKLEQDFIAALRLQPASLTNMDDVRLTVELYDTVRRYQQLLDPSAYFLHAWLLDTKEMRTRGIVADYMRHPDAPMNIEIETELQEAAGYIRDGDYTQARQNIDSANAQLDLIQK